MPVGAAFVSAGGLKPLDTLKNSDFEQGGRVTPRLCSASGKCAVNVLVPPAPKVKMRFNNTPKIEQARGVETVGRFPTRQKGLV